MKPLLTIGNVPLTEQMFSWSLTSGPMPYQTTFIAPNNEINDQIAALKNPVEIKIEVYGGLGQDIKTTQMFSKCYIHEPMKVSDFETMWKVSDRRYELWGKKVYCAYNVTRIKNQKVLLNATAAENDPVALRKFFDNFAAGRYLPWSVKTGGKPYGIGEIIRKELSSYGINVDAADLAKKDYVIENVIQNGEDVYSSLNFLMSKARLNLGIRADGSLFLYSIDFYDEATSAQAKIKEIQEQEKTKPGLIYKQDLQRIRPKKVTVKFEKMEEVWVKASEPNDDWMYINMERRQIWPKTTAVITEKLVSDRKAIGCVNVLQVPYPVTMNGATVNPGTYMPMKAFLDAIGYSEEKVREYWFKPGVIEFQLSQIVQSKVTKTLQIEPLANMIASSIRQNYRQTWMIDPYMLDYMQKWETRRCGVVDNYSQYRPPSPLWSDYAMFPKVRTVAMAYGTGLAGNAGGVINWIVDTEDPNREKPTLGSISMVDQELGVFRVSYPSVSLSGSVDEVVPCSITNPPKSRWVPGVIGRGAYNLNVSSLSENFVMEAIISVVWFADKEGKFNSTKRYYAVDFDFSSNALLGPCLGNPVDFLSTKEYARYNYVGELVNKGIIDSIANVEKNILMFSYKDRNVGSTTLPAFRANEVQLDGNLKAITTCFNTGRGAETIVDMRDIPTKPTMEQSIPYQTREYLYRQVNRGGI